MKKRQLPHTEATSAIDAPAEIARLLRDSLPELIERAYARQGMVAVTAVMTSITGALEEETDSGSYLETLAKLRTLVGRFS